MQRLLPLLFLVAMVGGGWIVMGPNGPELRQNGSRPQSSRASGPATTSPRIPATAASTSAANAPSAVDWRTEAANRPLGRTPASVRNSSWPAATASGRPALRIASYNIQVFGKSKADKPYIMETLAAIVRNFDIVAIQEIRTQDDYHLNQFLEYVNADGKQYNYVIGPRLGRSSSKEQYAFVYDTATVEVNRNSIYTVHDPDDLLHREPFVAMFRTRGPPAEQAFTFILVNIHTDPDETATELDALGEVYRVVRQSGGSEDDVIVLGDLNVDDRHLGELGRIPGVQPIVSGVFTNTRQSELYDNVVIHRPSTVEFTGRWGVYDVQRFHNLTVDQALQVSDHLPIWAEFSAYESAGAGRVATQPGPSAR